MIKELDKQDIAEMINNEMDAVNSAQRRIGMLCYPYREDERFMAMLEYKYGNLEYVKKCLALYEGSMFID